MRKVLVVLMFALFALSLSPPGWAATRHDNLPLHLGSSGPNVAELQYLIRDPRPRQNVFGGVKGIYKGHSTGYYGARTALDVYAYKYRIGYPSRYNSKTHPVAGKYFFALLLGHKQRTVEMVAEAQRRLQAVVPGASATALKIKAVEVSQLGVSESWGYNRGPQVNAYSDYFGLPHGLAWCEIFQQWSWAHGGYRPPFAHESFAVFYTVDWARYHGYLNAKAKVGALVAFLHDQGHIGYVVKVLASGYVTIEGNYNNHVAEVFHTWNDQLRVFIYVPGVA